MTGSTSKAGRRDFLRGVAGLALASVRGTALGGQVARERPNFLWITCEDLSPILGCYGEAYARTPNLDALARQSVRFRRAFAAAPVCSPARTSLLFGRHATTLGANNHRSRPLTPPEVLGFPAHLREAGYFCSNHRKTDYNTSRHDEIKEACFDSAGDWRDRPRDDQPFLSIVNTMTTHASHGTVWPYERFEKQVQSRLEDGEIHDPADAPVPPYYPDTPTVRRTLARYHDCATAMDAEVGRILGRLEEDGLAEETIVFFFSDHGTGLPRHKQTALDTGLQVPLLIRFPRKWRHLAPAEPGGVSDQLLSFVDFGPTVLHAADVALPAYMQGRPFLGEGRGKSRSSVFGSRDRLDEAYDVQRSLRTDRFRYLRNFMPHLPHIQQNRYLQTSEMVQELFRLRREGALEGEAAELFAPRAPEELYDIESDPEELHNLAADPEHAQILDDLRRQLRREMLGLPDLCLAPEFELTRRAAGRPLAALADDPARLPLDRIVAVAELVGMNSTRPEVLDRQAEALRDEDNVVRWWAVLGLRNGDLALPRVQSLLEKTLEDPAPLVAAEAALALVAAGLVDEALGKLTQLLMEGPEEEARYIARSSLYAGHADALLPLLERVAESRPEDLGIQLVIKGMQTLYSSS